MSLRYESQDGSITLALTGESLICRQLSVHREPEFRDLVDLLRGADLSFGNAECIFQDWRDTPSSVAGGGAPGGTYMAAPPQCIDELKWAGIDVVATANNHASDFGEAGVLTNLMFLEKHGLPQAGMGRTLTEASAPTYIDTPKGRVAVLAACDWGPRGAGDIPAPYPVGVIAAEQAPYSKGRPGVNLIRHQTELTLDGPTFDQLRDVSLKLGWQQAKADRVVTSIGWDRTAVGVNAAEEPDDDKRFQFMGVNVYRGDRCYVSTRAEPLDIERNLKWIREARRMADWVLVSFHNHGASADAGLPPAHSVAFARAAIDSGADLYVGHGTGRDRGLEIYRGKPVLYGLGMFIAQNDQLPWVPYESMIRYGLGHDSTASEFFDARTGHGTKGQDASIEMWESVVASVSYEGKELKSIKLHPIDLNRAAGRPQRGRPMLVAQGTETYERILKRIQERSSPFGTRIDVATGMVILT